MNRYSTVIACLFTRINILFYPINHFNAFSLPDLVSVMLMQIVHELAGIFFHFDKQSREMWNVSGSLKAIVYFIIGKLDIC